MCTLCETPTKFATFGKLENHIKRFHSAFNQEEKGTKRRKDEEEAYPKKAKRRKDEKEEVYPKKGKWSWE